ncbi:hypothetical protein Tco_0413784 [Tanacetum coccineum]
MRMQDMILQRRVGIYRKEMKAMNTLRSCRVVRHLAKVEVFSNLGVSGEEKPVRIILGSAGIVQAAKLCKQADIQEGGDEFVLLTQEYIRKVVEDVGEDEDFKCGLWNYLKNGKLEQVVAIIKSRTSNALGDLIVTLKDLSGLHGCLKKQNTMFSESENTQSLLLYEFASIFMDNTPKKTVQLSELSNEESVEGADVAIPLAAVNEGGLKKDEITAAPVWVKLHNVPIVACSEVGLSLITTKVSSKNALVDSLILAILFQNGSGHSMETIDIEYEWQPPRCDTCKIFDHIDDQCPKKVKVDVPNQESDDGFLEVTRKYGKGKQNGKPQHINGVWLTKPQPNYFYRAVSKPVIVNDEASTSQPKGNKEASSQPKFNVNDNGNPMDDLVDETRNKVEVPPKKTTRKTGVWLCRKADSPKRNVVFSSETKVHYFDRDDMEFDDMGQATEGWEHENAFSDNG